MFQLGVILAKLNHRHGQHERRCNNSNVSEEQNCLNCVKTYRTCVNKLASMPIICLGPICFPIWGLIPVVVLFVKNYWRKFAVWMGWAQPTNDSTQDIEEVVKDLDASKQKVVHIKTFDQLQNLKSSSALKNEFLVVKFGAEWCKPCKAIQPFFEQLSAVDTATFGDVDVDAVDPALKAMAQSLPTFIVFQNKKEIQRIVGGDKQKLFGMLQVCGEML